jgi:RNA polymerase sigma-70 factor (ECF subfamily)
LIKRSQNGETEAFGEIVKIMSPNIFAVTYRLTKNREAALDLTQEVLIAAWTKIKDFRFEAKFSSWVFRIAHNKSLNYLNSARAASGQIIERSASEQTVSGSAQPDEILYRKELKASVQEFMGELPPAQKMVFELRFYQHKTFEEIAKITERAVGTVKTNYREAVKKLRLTAESEGWRP